MKEETESPMSAPAIHHHRWTRGQYEKMVEVGILDTDDSLELLDGHIVDMPPQESRHASVIRVVAKRLGAAFGDSYQISEEKPIALGDWSEPEPDIAVLKGGEWDFVDAHPASAELLVEVSDTSLSKDRGVKKAIYARAGIPEYWIVNLPDSVLEVYRDPSGDDYRSRTVLRAGDVVHTLVAAASALSVADLLPPR